MAKARKAAPKEWRNRNGSDVWHFAPSCQWWPILGGRGVRGYRTVHKKPTTGELCNECQAKARRAT